VKDLARPSFCVVIPAHNEASVLGRCLAAWFHDLMPGEAEVVVVANGCTDSTAGVARSFGVQVVETSTASKSAALTVGDRTVTAFPRIYLDADIRMTADGLRELAAVLAGPEVRVAAPSVRFVTAGASRAVRAFYRVSERLPYAVDGLSGRGVYGLSRSARARFDDFPDLTADDLFVDRLFSGEERVTVPGTSEVQVPRELRSLIKVRRRIAAGNRELASSEVSDGVAAETASSAGDTARALIDVVRAEPRRFLDALVYVGVVLTGRAGARISGTRRWQRDESTRGALPRLAPAVLSHCVPPVQRVGYLVSMYPALSHAFIAREVRALQELGVAVVPFSVRPCPPDQIMSEEMRLEASRTRVLLDEPTAAWVRAHMGLLARAPGAWLKGLLQALRTGQATLRDRLWQVFYFAEAVLLVDLARQADVRHFHVHFANNGADIARRAVAVGCLVDGPDKWSWSLAMHGPTEFESPEKFDLRAKIGDASFVACISEYALSQLKALRPSAARLEIVRMGVDIDRFHALADERRTRVTGPIRVLFVGRLVPEKAPEVLLEATAILRSQGRKLEVAVIGGGPLAESLVTEVERLQLADCVELLGPRGQDELPDWYSWADVFCLPSRAEGVPVVLMEAMASELPVLTTGIAGIPELVQDFATGLLVRPGDALALADGLARLDDDPELRAALGRSGRQHVLRYYTPERNARALRSLLVSMWS
jgi:colanic acid/amylovoran biosynthesis glycosyltransferase